MTCQGGDVSDGPALFSLHPLGLNTAEEHVSSFRMCLEMSGAGGFSRNGVPGYVGSNSVGLCCQGSEVTAAWGVLTKLPAAPELTEPPVPKLLRAHNPLNAVPIQCPPYSLPPAPGGLGAAVVPAEGT